MSSYDGFLKRWFWEQDREELTQTQKSPEIERFRAIENPFATVFSRSAYRRFTGFARLSAVSISATPSNAPVITNYKMSYLVGMLIGVVPDLHHSTNPAMQTFFRNCAGRISPARSVPEVKKSSLVSYYAARAPGYERIYNKPERQADLAELRSIVRQTFAGKEILEIACGTGYWTEVVAASAAAVTALDLPEEVLQIAGAKRFRAPVRFLQADAYALPDLPKVTGCLGAFWWSHVPKNKVQPFLEGLHAKLPAGATVLFIDNRYVAGNSTPISHVDEDGNSYQTRTLDDGSSHEVLKNFPSEEELLNEITPFGSEASVRLLKYYWALSYRAQ